MPAFLLRRTEALVCRLQGGSQPCRTDGNPPDFQNRLHSGYILAEQENRLISQNRLDGGWMDLPG